MKTEVTRVDPFDTDAPRISLLAVTSRPAMRAHLERTLDAQASAILAGNAPHGPSYYVVERVIVSDYGGSTPCGLLRARALEAATGELVAWVDDDDWVDPRRTLDLLDARDVLFDQGRLDRRRWWGLAPNRLACWDVERDTVGVIATMLPVFAAGLYRRREVVGVPWSNREAGSDTRWLKACQMARGGLNLAALPTFAEAHGLYALHAKNTGNRTRRDRCTEPREDFLRRHGKGDEVVAQTAELRELLRTL